MVACILGGVVVTNVRSQTSFNNGAFTTCGNQRVAAAALSHAQTSFSTGGSTFPFDWVRKYFHANDGVPNLFAQRTASNNLYQHSTNSGPGKVGDGLSCGPDPEQSVAICKGFVHFVFHWRSDTA